VDTVAGPLVVVCSGSGRPCVFNQLVQRVGGLRVQRDYPFGVGLADWYSQPRVAIWVGVEAIEGQASDFAAASSAPPQEQQCRASSTARSRGRTVPAG
jgi:hypothetical protein